MPIMRGKSVRKTAIFDKCLNIWHTYVVIKENRLLAPKRQILSNQKAQSRASLKGTAGYRRVGTGFQVESLPGFFCLKAEDATQGSIKEREKDRDATHTQVLY